MAASGAGIVYTGYAWRGRATVDAAPSGPADPKTVREVMMLSKDQSEFKGRWFWGEYQEFGMDVTLRRATGGPIVTGTDLASLAAGAHDATIHIYGDNLPSNLTANDVSLGAGVSVDKIISQEPGVVTVSASVSPQATPGRPYGHGEGAPASGSVCGIRSHRLPEGEPRHLVSASGQCHSSAGIRAV